MKDKDNISLCPEDPVTSTLFFNRILERFKIDLNSPETQLASRWGDIVGSSLGSMCSFKSISNGVLTVVCSHPAHATAVRMNKTEMLKNIKSVFPQLEISKIIIRMTLNNR